MMNSNSQKCKVCIFQVFIFLKCDKPLRAAQYLFFLRFLAFAILCVKICVKLLSVVPCFTVSTSKILEVWTSKRGPFNSWRNMNDKIFVILKSGLLNLMITFMYLSLVEITCDPPNNRLEKLQGRLMYDGNNYPLDNENVILRVCFLNVSPEMEHLIIISSAKLAWV